MSNRLHESYMSDIGNADLMSDADERALAVEIGRGSQDALNRLVGANLRYVVTLANTYRNQGVETEDLISEGNIGLMRAAARFRPEYNKRFATFAAPYIRQCMEAAIAGATMGSADAQGLRLRSMDAPVPEGCQNTYTLLSVLENPNAEKSDQAVEQQSDVEQLKRRMARLDDRERTVVGKLYGIDGPQQTMMETAIDMGLKRERVRQIRDKALRKLRRRAR